MSHKYLISEFWLYKQFGGKKKKWTTLSHNGVLFPSEYVQHNIPVKYNGNDVYLDKESEEYATLYAKFIESDYIKSNVFRKNFWKDWKKILGSDHIIKDLEGVDFRPIYDHLLKEKERKKELKKTMSEEEKEKIRLAEDKFKIAVVDGKEQAVGNYRIEAPGIFLGRGCAPRLGKIKKRIYPEDVTLNLGKEASIPETLQKHRWGQIINDHYVEWLASWKDNVTGKIKYMWLGSQSDQKARNDLEKFELARKLKRKIKLIREANDKMLRSDSKFSRQIATALYFIDRFAIRIGNEKSELESDTVGISTLRIEHLTLMDDNKIKLSFLGKDSVPYQKIVMVDEIVYKNIQEFVSGKDKNSQVFDLINSNDVNKYLQSFMPKLSAKIFRTFNASNLFAKELKKLNKKYDTYDEADKINLLLDGYNRANLRVSVLCNHQKAINKGQNKQIENINNMIKKIKSLLRKAKSSNKKNPEKIKKLQNKVKLLKAKRELKVELKNYSLGTSRQNYIDARITIAFLKRHNIPVEKVFSKALREKFSWAFENIDKNFKW